MFSFFFRYIFFLLFSGYILHSTVVVCSMHSLISKDIKTAPTTFLYYETCMILHFIRFYTYSEPTFNIKHYFCLAFYMPLSSYTRYTQNENTRWRTLELKCEKSVAAVVGGVRDRKSPAVVYHLLY